jgi:hypothetical protein
MVQLDICYYSIVTFDFLIFVCYIEYKFQYHITGRGLSNTIIDMNYVVKN